MQAGIILSIKNTYVQKENEIIFQSLDIRGIRNTPNTDILNKKKNLVFIYRDLFEG